MKVIQYPEIIETPAYELVWELRSNPGAGYSFDCDDNGNILNEEALHHSAKANLKLCLENANEELVGPYIRECWSRYREPMIIECDCGQEVHLYGDTECDTCNQWYNSSGQALNPPHLWEEDAWHIEEEDC